LALAELKFTKCGVQIPPSYFPTFLFKGCFLTAHWSGSYYKLLWLCNCMMAVQNLQVAFTFLRVPALQSNSHLLTQRF